VAIDFSDAAIRRMSEIAEEVNARSENIGARRLHTIMEVLLEDISFNAPDLKDTSITITPEYVDERFDGFIQDQDLTKYIL
jgi:ATP-dependent HslUV protease ATP-binding subunit HslU